MEKQDYSSGSGFLFRDLGIHKSEVYAFNQSMDDLTQNWSRLTLSKREGPGCCLNQEDSTKDFYIAAKFFTKRALNIDVIARTFTPLWRACNGFKIQNMGDHIILFTFDNKAGVERILQSEPWSFDKHLVVMERYEKEEAIHKLKFNKASFWVQLHGIPIRFMTMEAALKISLVIGDVSSPIKPKDSDGGSFLRVQASIDLSLPLCQGCLVSLGNGKQTWVSFKYERLPNLCYWCGCLTHDDKDCEMWIESEGTLQPDQRQFGPSIRALDFVPLKKNVIKVPGFYTARKQAVSAMDCDGSVQPPVD